MKSALLELKSSVTSSMLNFLTMCTLYRLSDSLHCSAHDDYGLAIRTHLNLCQLLIVVHIAR